MDRVALRIGNISIYWYAVIIAVGMIVAMCLSYAEAKRQKINLEFWINLLFYIILFGVIGARLYYVLFNLSYYLSDPLEIVKVWHGGLAIHGGIIAGVIVILLYTRKYNVNTLKTLPIMAVSVMIGQAIGRWGNFFNQEAFGGVVSKGFLETLKLPEFIINGMYINGSYHHPTFLFSITTSC